MKITNPKRFVPILAIASVALFSTGTLSAQPQPGVPPGDSSHVAPAPNKKEGKPPKGEHKGDNWKEKLEVMKTKLDLTDEQVTKITAIYEAQGPKIEAIKADKDLPKEDRKAKMKALRDEVDAKVEAVLTPEQLAKRAELRKAKKDKKTEEAPGS